MHKIEGQVPKHDLVSEDDAEMLRNQALRDVSYIRPETLDFMARRIEEIIQQVQDQNIGTIVFLDRSARPLAGLFKRRWDQLFDPSENSPRMPEVKFANLGTEKIGVTVDTMSQSESYKKLQHWINQVEGDVMVVDEMKLSGTALRIGTEVMASMVTDKAVVPVAFATKADREFFREYAFNGGMPWFQHNSRKLYQIENRSNPNEVISQTKRDPEDRERSRIYFRTYLDALNERMFPEQDSQQLAAK